MPTSGVPSVEIAVNRYLAHVTGEQKASVPNACHFTPRISPKVKLVLWEQLWELREGSIVHISHLNTVLGVLSHKVY